MENANGYIQGFSVTHHVLKTNYTGTSYSLPMVERVGCGDFEVCVCGRSSTWVRAPTGAISKESFSSNQGTGKVFSPEMTLYSKL